MRAIAFDLWETLISDLPEIAVRQEQSRLQRVGQALHAAGHLFERPHLEAAYRSAWTDCWERYWSRDRDMPARQQIIHMLEALHLDPDSLSSELLDQVETGYTDAAAEHLPIAITGALEMLGDLRSLGLSIGIVSNPGRTPGSVLRVVLDRLGLAQHVDAAIFSNELGICKPQREIFEAVRQQLGCRFGEMIFVGDNPYADVYGSQQCGMTAIHFAPPTRGMAVGPMTRDGWTLAPHHTVRSLTEVTPLVRSMLQ